MARASAIGFLAEADANVGAFLEDEVYEEQEAETGEE